MIPDTVVKCVQPSPICLRSRVHQRDEPSLGARDVLGERDRGVVPGRQQQPVQQREHRHPLAERQHAPTPDPEKCTASGVISASADGDTCSSTTSAVIIFVRLAIGRPAWASRCHSTRPVQTSNSIPLRSGSRSWTLPAGLQAGRRSRLAAAVWSRAAGARRRPALRARARGSEPAIRTSSAASASTIARPIDAQAARPPAASGGGVSWPPWRYGHCRGG